MSDDDAIRNDMTLMDTLERLRAEKFPHIPRDLVREILRMHADVSASPAKLVSDVDGLLHQHVPEGK
jgi:hypothetical protein